MYDIINSPAYRKAFIAYLRRGMPPDISMKAALEDDHVVEKYIWRTQGDDKVRASHAALEGQVFSWDHPPAIGHPGQDYNCRCAAEPYLEEIDPAGLRETNVETIIYAPEDKIRPWDTRRMLDHYLDGKGVPVTLQDMGHMQYVIDHVQNYVARDDKAGATISRQILDHLADEIRKAGAGPFNGSFHDYYDFKPVAWAHGNSRFEAQAEGMVSNAGPFLVFNLTVDYRFSDIFQDPLDLFERLRIPFEPGDKYKITGIWRTRVEAVIYRDAELSHYKAKESTKPK